MPTITTKQWRAKLATVAKQTAQYLDPIRSFVRCGCNKMLKPHQSYKCLYCEEAFCKECAEVHFNKTVKEYREENPIAEDPKPLCSGFKIFPGGAVCSGCGDCE